MDGIITMMKLTLYIDCTKMLTPKKLLSEKNSIDSQAYTL